MSTYSQPSFSCSTWKKGAVWMCKLGVICKEWLALEVKLLLSANRKSYMPRRLARQRMTLSDLEWRFHYPYRALSLRYLSLLFIVVIVISKFMSWVREQSGGLHFTCNSEERRITELQAKCKFYANPVCHRTAICSTKPVSHG